MNFTLVSTTFNENYRLEKSIVDIERQSLLPTEIIITDAGSTDGTYEKLINWGKKSSIDITILSEKGCNVARGRNIAIQHAKYTLIVSTDFGCRYHPDWLKELTSPIQDRNVEVVGGFFGVIEDNIQSLSARANYLLSNGYMCYNDENFIPSSRSIAYYKDVWQDVGGYCEWLTLAADDLIFGKALLAKGYNIHIVEKQHVFWGRHEKRMAYAKEAGRYGLGDGEAKVNRNNTFKLFAETGLRYLFFPLILIGLRFHILFFLPVLFCLLGFRPYWFVYNQWKKFRSEKYNFAVFIEALMILELSRFNYLKGYWKGFFSQRPERIVGVRRIHKTLQLS
ncbi:glycosyltransferase [Salinimicrobium sediminilitoris]|uniref:glycosyltransferase n=1 Tax=Salinimicrobium sediminilitoris TaxID=2876715 RepID=UPI001E2A062E|nr:glycosyltransferase [Salinimicrobium sediminilitoris]MCC8358453.1 glycosyltransferase [Salinimicrobium sediminilitoris]